MTTEQLRPLFLVAKVQLLDIATHVIRVGQFTALSKPDGGVRGIVAGDVIRRLVARTMAQLQKAVEVATALFQYALSTKAGCECVGHALPGLTQLHLDTTIKSIDGISALDLISRESILMGLTRVDRGQAALPFVRFAVRIFVGGRRQDSPQVFQGDGDEQGDALMPFLFCLGHRALVAAQRQLRVGERLLAFLDDIHLATAPARVGLACTAVQQELWIHAGIRVHTGKTKVWNRVGIRPVMCNVLERIAHMGNPQALLLCGLGPASHHTSRASRFGDPIGSPRFRCRPFAMSFSGTPDPFTAHPVCC